MASENRPASKESAPDPATGYGREKPENEAGAGRMDNNVATPSNQPNRDQDAVKHRQQPRQINAHEAGNQRGSVDPNREMPDPEAVDHSMTDEEPLGWDQAPQGKMPDRDKRNPKTEGKGGTPDASDD